jgi:hypothetical protein
MHIRETAPTALAKAVQNFLHLRNVKVTYTDHAKERMIERHVTPQMVMYAIRRGKVQEVTHGKAGNDDGWNAKLRASLRDGRFYEVIVNVNEQELSVVTVCPVRNRIAA